MKVKLTYAQFDVESGEDNYLIAYDDEEGWYCNCPDRHFRKHECKHIREARHDLRKGKVIVDEVVPETQTMLGI